MNMDAADHVLGLLYDRRGLPFSMDELLSASGLDRDRLERLLEDLERRGYPTERCGTGLRLVLPVRLNAHLIKRALATLRVGREVICFDWVGSTNDVAFEMARQPGADGVVVTAEAQRSGRGRQGRKWMSRAGENVLLSVLLMERGGEALPHEALTIAAG